MEKFKVLIADDESEIRSLLGIYVKAAGFEVLEAETGDTAFAHVESEFPAIIISDIRMPHGTGIELLRRLRHVTYPETLYPNNFRPHIYIMTGLIEQNESYLSALGARRVYLKPFDFSKTVDEIVRSWNSYLSSQSG